MHEIRGRENNRGGCSIKYLSCRESSYVGVWLQRAGWTDVSSCVTDETGQPDQEQSKDIGIPMKSQEGATSQNCFTAKDTSNTLFSFSVVWSLVWSLLQPYRLIMKSAFLQATDKTFVDKLNSSFKGNLHFQPGRGHVLAFSIIHYAGKVCTICRKNSVVMYVEGGICVTNKVLC